MKFDINNATGTVRDRQLSLTHGWTDNDDGVANARSDEIGSIGIIWTKKNCLEMAIIKGIQKAKKNKTKPAHRSRT